MASEKWIDLTTIEQIADEFERILLGPIAKESCWCPYKHPGRCARCRALAAYRRLKEDRDALCNIRNNSGIPVDNCKLHPIE